MRRLKSGEAVGAVVVTNSEIELRLVDGLASSGGVDGGLLVSAGPRTGEKRQQRSRQKSTVSDGSPAKVRADIGEGEAGGVVSRVQRRVVEAGADDVRDALGVGEANECAELVGGDGTACTNQGNE